MSNDNQSREQSFREFQEKRIEELLEAYVLHLREIADKASWSLETGKERNEPYAQRVSNVMHAVNWGLANAGAKLESALGNLASIQAASDTAAAADEESA